MLWPQRLLLSNNPKKKPIKFLNLMSQSVTTVGLKWGLSTTKKIRYQAVPTWKKMPVRHWNRYPYVDLNRQEWHWWDCIWSRHVLLRSLRLSSSEGDYQYAGISDVKMEEGSMRVGANISLRPYGQKFGTRLVKTSLTSARDLNTKCNVRLEILRSGGQINQKHVVTRWSWHFEKRIGAL